MVVGEQKETLVRKTQYERESSKSQGERRGEQSGGAGRKRERKSASGPNAMARVPKTLSLTVRCRESFPARASQTKTDRSMIASTRY